MESNQDFIPGTCMLTNKYYKIKSKEGTVLDSWGGITGERSASFQPDNDDNNYHRKFKIVHVSGNYYKIVSLENTVLDSWGGKTGEDSASFQPNDCAGGDLHRQFTFHALGDGYFKIRSKEGTVLDSWGGKTGKNSAAFQPDDNGGNLHRKFRFVPLDYKLNMIVSDFNFGPKNFVQDILEKNKRVAFNSTENIICKEVGIEVGNEYGEDVNESFSWGFNEEIGYNMSTTLKCGVPIVGEAEFTVGFTASFGSNQNWSHSTTRSFKSHISFTPTKTGIYKIGKIVYRNSDVELPFTAKLLIRATKKSDENHHYSYKEVESFVKMMIKFILN